ncbi:DNA circularization N-terminal domain-containing protein [Marinomonas transparens]|uniref:DNA circularization N-terminal domain-containing protein n=1 Tax=Marinomonas transparens TaxID=2795388 RepID=A0A934N5L2_9GAMM|nr:DNA circularization N-terminal domain-containing protein [Marinomonas transparens]MBJ7537161.1 DNA circularization N-terminal domain-containing protein [Marinomonas transparens]
MTWRNRLQQGSFREIAFFTDQASGQAGRRVAVHEYPQQEAYFAEDLGKKAETERLKMFVSGEDYDLTRDRLMKALNKPGVGKLVHPYLGSMMIQVTDYDWTISTQRGGYCEFNVQYVRAGKRSYPLSSNNSASILSAAIVKAKDTVSKDFAKTFSVDNTASFVEDAARQQLSEGVAVLRTLNGQITGYLNPLSNVANKIDDFVDELDDKLVQPKALADALNSVVEEVFDDMDEMKTVLSGYQHTLDTFVTTTVIGSINDVTTALVTEVNTVIGGIDETATKLTTQMSSAIDVVSTTLTTQVDALVDEIEGATEALAQDINSAVEETVTSLSTQVNSVVDDITTTLSSEVTRVTGQIDELATLLEEQVDEADEALNGLTTSLTENVNAAKQTVDAMVVSLAAETKAVINDAVLALETEVSRVVAEAGDEAASLATDVEALIEEMETRLTDQVKTVIVETTESITTQANAVMNKANAMVASINAELKKEIKTFNRQQEALNSAAMNTLFTATSTLAMAKSMVEQNGLFTTLSEAKKARDLVLSHIDELIEVGTDEAYEAWADLQTAIMRRLDELEPNLAKEAKTQIEQSMPALVMAYDLYGDARRELEFIRRNGIVHPCIVPAGVDLEVLQ